MSAMTTPPVSRAAGMPPLVRKQYALDITKSSKAEDPTPTFEGAASVYNIIDLHGDVIEPGAFEGTLKTKGATRPLLYQHDPHRPIGLASFEDSASALLTTGMPEPTGAVPDAVAAMALVRQGAIKGLSIGFDILAERWEGGVRVITEIDLWEVSIVTWPANPLANITSLKDAGSILTALRAKAIVADAACHLKAGRVLSAKNLGIVQSAYDALGALIEAAKVDDAEAKTASVIVQQEGTNALTALRSEIRSFSTRS